MSRGTPHRAIRIPDELWGQLKDQATQEGKDASAIVRKLIAEYLEKQHDKRITTVLK